MVAFDSVQTEASSNAELVASSLAGNREAFRRVVACLQKLVCSLARRRTVRLSRSEGLARDVFVVNSPF